MHRQKYTDSILFKRLIEPVERPINSVNGIYLAIHLIANRNIPVRILFAAYEKFFSIALC